ncbi:Mesoderm-specific transcript-like protein [Trichoplax sp. H2]|uniref:AB hydrolase-1 domain-containing protein n=1 Tax=Trichoplax adhaerens TaxID=10228 RepID=B3RW12_TRIAD|nr:hypothetical protein TRIADDRAFT_55848 [Trichoplax adhaerens]EDV25591.1 hypothetical protein TRIADDRAFT_55848 [Trichoplax adhaerens]RDD38292.1 Mesoderm-specific transcript-like protein [Trichoplax sp. H2]|eukprot:XP_002111624.1 hypothetical protein TRIADDRAFT_55848 [Trichoplax adhaerens]
MAFYLSRRTTIIAVLIAGLYYIYFPSCSPSENLKDWQRGGQYIKYGKYDIFYHDSLAENVNQGNEATLLVHGFPTSSYDWHKVSEGIRMNVGRIVTIDMLGFGFSDKPLDINYTVGLQADLYEDVLMQLNITQVHILAHDFGDTVSLEMLRRFNERQLESGKNRLTIKSLALLNGGLFPKVYKPRLIQHMLVHPSLKDILPRIMNYYQFRYSFSAIFGKKYDFTSQESMDIWQQITYKKGVLILGNILGYLHERQINGENWLDGMTKNDIPVIFIYGPEDPINPPIVVQEFKKRVPRVECVVLEDIGHYPQLEDPYNVLQNYLRFRKSF